MLSPSHCYVALLDQPWLWWLVELSVFGTRSDVACWHGITSILCNWQGLDSCYNMSVTQSVSREHCMWMRYKWADTSNCHTEANTWILTTLNTPNYPHMSLPCDSPKCHVPHGTSPQIPWPYGVWLWYWNSSQSTGGLLEKQITISGLIRPDLIRYRGYMIMTNRVKLIIHMTLNGIRPDQVLSKWHGKLYMIRYDKAWLGDLNMVRTNGHGQMGSGSVRWGQVWSGVIENGIKG